MSLVNQMLRDLEQRRGDAAAAVHTLEGLRAAPANGPEAGLRWPIALAGLGLIAAAAAVGWWLASADEAAPGTASPASIQVASPAAVPATTRAETMPENAQLAASDAGADSAAPQEPAAGNDQVPAGTPGPADRPEAAAPAPTAGDATPKAPVRVREAAPTPAPAMRKSVHTPTPAEQAEAAYADAVRAFGRGQLGQVEAALQRALAADPDHVRARETLAGVLVHQGRLAEAERVLAEGLARNPTRPGLARLQGRLLAERGQDAAAIGVLEGALPEAGNDAGYLALLAGVYQRSGRAADAVAAYRGALALLPDRGPWWMGLGLSLESLGDSAGAREAYGRALQTRLQPRIEQYVRQRLAVLDAAAGEVH
ncbi:tetratricopeptide repeat protein [Thiohalobacter sp.]|uniref:tetratricopeptide repeat protein n=1 Tax=Thiohalobacter sp. TaxID=2025948 RepID=UPI00262F4AED|nr:tetratricopeptide repeat protein [Thiohalobacter sp.]